MILEIQYLKKVGADKLKHKNGSLLNHLIGVHEILKQHDRSIVEQKAGLFHSIYGTEYYSESKKLLVSREEIQRIVGIESEQLVFTFCNLSDRITKLLFGISLEQHILTQLRWIEYANLKEQNSMNKHLKYFEKLLNITQ